LFDGGVVFLELFVRVTVLPRVIALLVAQAGIAHDVRHIVVQSLDCHGVLVRAPVQVVLHRGTTVHALTVLFSP
jgi:hypothetical protein